MSDDKKVRLPASTGGLMQYYDDYHSKISISPWHVIILTIAVMIFIIALHFIAP
jgi:preprotein translocase subunit Sec61beta